MCQKRRGIVLCERRKPDGKEDHKNRTGQKTGAAERAHDEASLCILPRQYSIRGAEAFSGSPDTILHKADTGKRTLDRAGIYADEPKVVQK